MRVLFYLFFIAISFSSCSNKVNILHSWKSDKTSGFKDGKILVIARTDDKQARIAFEDSFTDKLREKGYQTARSYTALPQLDVNAKLDDDKLASLELALKKQDYTGVIISILKDYDEQVYKNETGGVSVGFGFGGGYYPGYYGNFSNYYNYPSSYMSYSPSSTSYSKEKTYVLESNAYNLEQEGEDQLLAVVTTELNDPQNIYEISDEYVEKVLESLGLE